MATLAGGLRRDPQLESALERRRPELGLEAKRDVSAERVLERTRDRSMSL